MAKWTISKFFSFVVFIVMMILFFFWITGQVSDLGLLFGFRTSHTVANDIAGVITSVGGLPGYASVAYTIEPGQRSQSNFKYDVDISNKIVCVTSYLSDRLSSTTDCASHPYDLTEPVKVEGEECVNFRMTKTLQAGEEKSSLSVEAITC